MAAEWAAWAGVGVTAVGFVFLYYQLKYAADQARQTARVMTSNLYGHVAEAMDRVNSRLLANPQLIPYFHENVELPDDDDTTRRQTELVCETILDMADSVTEQRRVRPDDMDWSTWFAYFRWLHQNGPALRTFLDENVDFFPDYIFAVFGRIHVRERNRGALKHIYCAHEFASPEALPTDSEESGDEAFLRKALGIGVDQEMPTPGYPWVRTWLFRRASDEVRKRDVDPVIVADVDVTASKHHQEDIATVRFIVTDEKRVDGESQDAVRDWVLGTFDRTGIRWVEFVHESSAGSTTRVEKFDLSKRNLDLYGKRLFGGPSRPPPRSRWQTRMRARPS